MEITKKQQPTIFWFSSKIAGCTEEITALQAENRDDEAVFAKIRMNVYDIFRTVFSVCTQTAGDDERKLVEEFLSRLQQIPRSWQASFSTAEAHGDVEKAHIERLKLDAAGEVGAFFRQTWEVEA